MAKFMLRFMIAAIVIAAFLLTIGLPVADCRPSSDSDLSNMVEALRVLEQYDKMYSQLARPRFGRSLIPAAPESHIPLDDMVADLPKSR